MRSIHRVATAISIAVVGLFVASRPCAAQNLFFGSIVSQAGPNYLFTSDLNGGALSNILPAPGGPVSIDVDPTIQRVFWSDVFAGQWRIRSASLTGSAPTVIATYPNTVNNYGLAVDTVNQRVYWADGLTIRRADYNGSNAITVATGVNAQAIEVDAAAGKIFWADRGQTTPNLGEANLDGTSPQTIASFAPGVYPAGITANPNTQTIFWSDYLGGTVATIPYGGGAMSTILTGVAGPAGLDLELTTNRLYIVERSTASIAWSAPAGGALTPVFTGSGSTFGEEWDIAAIVPEPGCAAIVLTISFVGASRRRLKLSGPQFR